MRAVVHVDDGVVEVNYMWLPTWIGLNSGLLKEIGAHMQSKAAGLPLNDTTMQALHDALIDFLCVRYPSIKGLKAYLDGLLHIDISESDASENQG